MPTQAQLDTIENSPPEGNKRNIRILVVYSGNNIEDPNSYQTFFSGDGVTEEGHLVCFGAAGDTPANKKKRHVLKFRLDWGKNIEHVSFVNPNDPNQKAIFAGDCGNEDCPVTESYGPDKEFDEYEVKPNGDFTIINRKMNTDKRLGYRLKLWVKHWGGGVKEIEIDPRIINK